MPSVSQAEGLCHDDSGIVVRPAKEKTSPTSDVQHGAEQPDTEGASER